METILLQLLTDLERIGEIHPELYDSEVREQMGSAIMEGFVRRISDFVLPSAFGLYGTAANQAVRAAMVDFINHANRAAEEAGLTSFHSRLAAFQNPKVRTSSRFALDYDELFGHSPPDWYDETGNVRWDRVR